MTGYKDIFQERENRNWLKAVLAVQITKEGLSDFVKDVATKLQQDILTSVINSNGLLPGTTCNKCRTENVLTCKTQGICSQTRACKFHRSVETQPRQCVAKVCNTFQSIIRKHHRFDRPSWGNTDSTKWCTDFWEVAKCYFPPDGYCDKQGADDTDLNGVISPIINCTYFQQFMDENLNQSSNTFTVAREVGRQLRHSTTLVVTDTDLTDLFSVLKKALSDPKRLQNNDGATSAYTRLSKLYVDQLLITTDDIAKVIQDTIKQTRQLQDDLRDLNKDTRDLQNKLADLQTLETEIKQIVSNECGVAIKAIQDEADTKVGDLNALSDKLEKHAQERILYIRDSAVKVLNDVTATNVSQLDNKGAMVCERIQQTGNTVVQGVTEALKEEKEKVVADARNELKEACRIQTEVIRTQQYKPEDDIYEERKRELRHVLANHYWTEHDSIPLSPLMPEEDDKLVKFYMALKMNKVDTKSSTKYVQTRDSVDTYKALFYDGNTPHRNIYIQGEAGIGKSTFCTKLGLVWSETNIPDYYKKDNSINKSIVKPNQSQVFSDESIVKEFDFVFLLALRNVDGECELENIIDTQIIMELPDHTKYAGLVPKVLDKERCLIILDGLDEWSHRGDLCRKSGHIPHRKSWSKTTVLTSSRPWKMNEVRLKDSEISTLIQVTGITDSETFIENVLKCLNDKYQTIHDVRDFITYMKNKKLEHFLDIPVIAMQLLWLWHSGHELGDSKCQIYVNMLDMLLGRAEEKSPSTCDDTTDNSKAGLSPCFESTKFCEQHKMLLDCLSSLAFHTLHSVKREESLVFSESIVTRHMKSTAARKLALTTGILSQHKSPPRNPRRSHFCFLHKTFQEFLAANYIAAHADESENIIETLFQVYGQTIYILDISELFIFVCGLNTEMSSKVSDSVMKSFSVMLTNHIEELHTSGGDYSVEGMTEPLQKMILDGYKESISNGNQNPQLALHHVVYHKDISVDDKICRDRMVDRNVDKIVTLCAGTWGEKYLLDEVTIQQILTQSSHTLSHVRLFDVKGLTGACLDLFTNITLKSLYLYGIYTHFDIKVNTSSLLYCYLGYINKQVETSVLSALSAAPQLHTLYVIGCKNMHVLCQVLPTLPMLHRLDVWDIMIPAYLCRVLSTVSQLQRLTAVGPRCEDPSLLFQALSSLSNLQYIRLGNTDIGTIQFTDLDDCDILLPNSIQEIKLDWVKLTCRSVRQLVDRLTQIPHKVTCTLYCTVRPEEEWGAILKYIQQSDIFEIHWKNQIYSYDENLRYSSDIYSNGLISVHFTKIQT